MFANIFITEELQNVQYMQFVFVEVRT